MVQEQVATTYWLMTLLVWKLFLFFEFSYSSSCLPFSFLIFIFSLMKSFFPTRPLLQTVSLLFWKLVAERIVTWQFLFLRPVRLLPSLALGDKHTKRIEKEHTKDASTANADQTRGKGGKHDLGEPHVHLWSAVVGVALKSANPNAQEVLQAHVDEANRGGPKSLPGMIHCAWLKKTFDKKYVRFYSSVHTSVDPIPDIIMASLTKMDGQEKYGTAPRSGLEREIQSKLDQLQWAVKTRVPLSLTRCLLCDDVMSERVHSAVWWFWQWGPCFRTSFKGWMGVSIQ